MKIEQITYHGWEHCYRLTDGRVELIVVADIGPRIISFRRLDSANILKEFPNALGLTGGNQWRIYGGHRFWHAPEYPQRSHYPDNAPVQVDHKKRTLVLKPPLQDNIQKELEISLNSDSSVGLKHTLINQTVWDIEIAPWALTVMANDGTAIIPLPDALSHTECVTPVNSLSLWSYTNLADPRWTWQPDRILVKQDPALLHPQKIGVRVTKGWLGYVHPTGFFVKTFEYHPCATYPDFGASVEIFVDGNILELETLGPLVRLAPGESTIHTERWMLHEPLSDIDKIPMETLPSLDKV
ncbi:MAG: hypothetical protein H6673_01305 [Anaerolineales bacterium]|nr:hypothetical protein [Anaerolineales bacterium]